MTKPSHVLYYEVSNFRFKLEIFNSEDLDFYLDQLNYLGVKHLSAADYNEETVQEIYDKGDCIISHYAVKSIQTIQS